MRSVLFAGTAIS